MVAEINNNSGLSVRFASKQDVTTVMEFIGKYWKSDHILSYDRELVEYLYLEKDETLNFVTASEVASGRLVAILGFIPTTTSGFRISLALWKAVNDKELRPLHAGLACLRYLVDEMSPKSIFCVGINEKTRVIYEYMGYSTLLMNHHFIVNSFLNAHNIIYDPPLILQGLGARDLDDYCVNLIVGSATLRITAANLNLEKYPKDIDYLCHRYIDHPRFAYKIIEILKQGQIIGLIFFRRVYVDKNSCIRIIDVIGGIPCLEGGVAFLIDEMTKNGDEYIDLVSWGLDEKELERIGFANRREHLDCVVPEHFSPFVRSNKDIWCFTNLPASEQFFRGDGDLDRPNS